MNVRRIQVLARTNTKSDFRDSISNPVAVSQQKCRMEMIEITAVKTTRKWYRNNVRARELFNKEKEDSSLE